jgi:hypothetical protein
MEAGKHPSALVHWCALIFVMAFPGIMAWVYFVSLAVPVNGKPPPAAFAVYLLSKAVQFGFPLLWVWHFERHRLCPSVPSFQGLALGVGFGLVVTAIIFYAYYGVLSGSPILEATPGKIRDKLILFHADTPSHFLLLGVFIAGIHSLMEEYYWRWFVFGELRKRMAVSSAIALSALAFMAHHVVVLAVYFPQHFFSAALPFSLCVAAGGAVWAWLYQRTGTIYSSWISHLLVDTAILTIGYEMVFR